MWLEDCVRLESGASQLLGIDLADSHAHLAVRWIIDGVADVEITSMGIELEIDGEPVDVTVERQMKDDDDLEIGDTLWSEERIRYYLRVPGLANLQQPVGARFAATFTLGWRRTFSGCPEQTGTETFSVEGVIAPVVDAASFALVPEPPATAAEPSATDGAQLQIAAEITSGLTVTVEDVRGMITYFGEEGVTVTPTTGIALLALSDLATQIDGEHAGVIGPGEILEIYTSSDPEASPAPLGPASTATTLGSVAEGRAVIVLEVDYEPGDGRPGIQTDVVAAVVDLD